MSAAAASVTPLRAPTGSPLWWIEQLYPKLMNRQPVLRAMSDYYDGNHPLPFLTKAHADKIRSEFRALLEDSQSNFMRLVVDVCEERLKVEGFRLSASSEATSDKATWDIWQANQMDQESQSAFTEALVKGMSYLSVWSDQDDDGFPDIAVEDPLETIVGYAPGSNYRRRAAALKVWTDEWAGNRRANVYLPDGIYKFEAAAAQTDLGTYQGSIISGDDSPKWKPLDDGFVANPLGVVPIIPLRNRPRLLREGESEIGDVYRVQNQINGFLFLLALAGYFGAHRQRWVAGIKLMTDEVTGEAREPYDAAIDKLWVSENPESKFGEFSQTDLGPYIEAIEQKVLHIAVTTRTPRHYLIQQGQSPSGDAIEGAESGLVKKVERKQRPFGEGLEETLRLARRFADEKDSPPDSEIVWADAETPTIAQTTDAVIKQFQAGLIPQATALEKLGFSQTEIARILSASAQDALLAALNPPAAPTTTPTPPEVPTL